MKTGEYRVVIVSRGRSKLVRSRTLRFFPTATLYVLDEEVEAYKEASPLNEVVPHGPCRTLGQLRNMALQRFDEEGIIMVDDDLMRVTSFVGAAPRNVTDPGSVLALSVNLLEMTRGAGAWIGGFNTTPSPKFFNPLVPLTLQKPVVYCILVFVGRNILYDEKLSMFDDHDLNLRALKENGLAVVDQRVCFQFEQTGSVGGNFVENRNSAKELAEQEYLFKKWGRHFTRKAF